MGGVLSMGMAVVKLSAGLMERLGVNREVYAYRASAPRG